MINKTFPSQTKGNSFFNKNNTVIAVEDYVGEQAKKLPLITSISCYRTTSAYIVRFLRCRN